jgi:hypothetical protein
LASVSANNRRVGWLRVIMMIAISVVLGTMVLSGCGSRTTLTGDQRDAARIRAYAYLPAVVRCDASTCDVSAHSRLHSQREAFLIGWPLVAGAVTDPSLALVKRVTLSLSDAKRGARLTLACDRNRAQAMPAGRGSVAAITQSCAWSWQGRY